MPVSVNQPQRREQRDPLDTIVKGLSIASSIYGIKEAKEKSDLLQKEYKLKEDERLRKEQGILNKGELLEAQKSFEVVPLGSKDAVAYKVQQDGQMQDIAFRAKKPEKDPFSQILARQRLEDAQTARTDKKTETLSGKLNSAGDLNVAIQNIEKEIGFSLDDYDGREVDLPGVNAPGVGRISIYDKDARTLDSKIAKIFNVELKDRSGAAVTTPEMERLKAEFSAGNFNTEEELLMALKDYKNSFKAAVANIESGFDPNVRDIVAERGGFTSKAIPKGKGSMDPKLDGVDTNALLGIDPKAAQQELIRRRGLGATIPKALQRSEKRN